MAGELIQYQTEDSVTIVRLRARDGNDWLSQAEIVELFQVIPQAVTKHIRAIYENGELGKQLVTITYRFERRQPRIGDGCRGL